MSGARFRSVQTNWEGPTNLGAHIHTVFAGHPQQGIDEYRKVIRHELMASSPVPPHFLVCIKDGPNGTHGSRTVVLIVSQTLLPTSLHVFFKFQVLNFWLSRRQTREDGRRIRCCKIVVAFADSYSHRIFSAQRLFEFFLSCGRFS